MISTTGQELAYADATSYDFLASSDYASPISGISVTNNGLGYWLIAQNREVYAYGDANYYGDPQEVERQFRNLSTTVRPSLFESADVFVATSVRYDQQELLL